MITSVTQHDAHVGQDGHHYLLSAEVPEPLYERLERLCEADNIDVDSFVESALLSALEGGALL